MSTYTSPEHQRRSDGEDGTIQQTRDQVTTAAHGTIEHYPLSTALVVFGAGFGLGVILGVAMADAGAQHSGRRSGNSVEAFGHRILDGLAGVVPQAIADRFQR